MIMMSLYDTCTKGRPRPKAAADWEPLPIMNQQLLRSAAGGLVSAVVNSEPPAVCR